MHRPSSDLWRLRGVQGIRMVEVPSEEWGESIAREKPDVIVALDWNGVASTFRDDEQAQFENVRRQGEVIEAAIRCGAGRFVGLGSQAEYGMVHGRVAEVAPSDPITAYGRAKVEALRSMRHRLEQAGLEWVWARIFSVYGPLEGDGWLLPSIADAAAQGIPIALTEARQPWSYLYAADAGTALTALASHPSASGIYNVGNPQAPALRESIEIFAHALGASSLLRFGARPPSGPVIRLEPDVTRLQSLGWTPGVSAEDGLARTAEWFSGVEVRDPFDPERPLPGRRHEQMS